MQVMDAYIRWISKDVPDLYHIVHPTMTQICDGTSGLKLKKVNPNCGFSSIVQQLIFIRWI